MQIEIQPGLAKSAGERVGCAAKSKKIAFVIG
jgi:hypothetical protein